MTEQEKQEKIVKAKARIAKNTITAGTIITAIVPNVAEATLHFSGHNTLSTNSVEQTVEAMPSSTIITELTNAENQPAFGSNEWLMQIENAEKSGDIKQIMSAQAANTHHQTTTMTAKSLQKDNKDFEQLMEKYNTPIMAFGGTTPTNVGDLNEDVWNDKGVSSIKTNMKLPQDIIANPHKAIDRTKIEITSDVGGLGMYHPEKNSIEIEAANLTAIKENAREIEKDLYAGSSIAQYFIALHESTHKRHDEKVGLFNIADTETDRLKKNRLTETVANATEYLAAAQMYADFKAKGVTTLQDTRIDENGNKSTTEIPLEKILDYYPGLKEIATQDGFDPKETEYKHQIVAASAKWWESERRSGYDDNAASSLDIIPTMEQQLEASRTNIERVPYDEQAKAMLKDIYIGGNHPLIDLTDCRELLDTMSDEQADEIIRKNAKQSISHGLPKETLQELDKYLTNLGLDTDQSKSEFLMQCYDDIVHRRNTDDEISIAIKDILLKNGGEITYADEMVETRLPNSNLATIRDKGGKDYVINADVDFTAKHNEQELAQTVEHATSQKNENSGLSVQQMMQLKNQHGM